LYLGGEEAAESCAFGNPAGLDVVYDCRVLRGARRPARLSAISNQIQ
jgi:hypothetical protein